MATKHVISVSGGKDSTAVLLLAMERCPSCSMVPVFCDTDNEHQAVYDDLACPEHGEGKDGNKRWSHGAKYIKGSLGPATASGGGQNLASAFMVQANGGFNSTPARDLRDPMNTSTTRDRLAFATVWLKGEPWEDRGYHVAHAGAARTP